MPQLGRPGGRAVAGDDWSCDQFYGRARVMVPSGPFTISTPFAIRSRPIKAINPCDFTISVSIA
jgi:hypothetical protein